MKLHFLYSLLLFLVLAEIVPISGQSKKAVGIVAYSTVDQNLDKTVVKQLEAMIADVFDKSCRFEIVIINHLFVVDEQLLVQKGEAYINSEIVKQGERLAAKYIAYAYVTSPTITPKTENNVQTNGAEIKYSFNYVDVKTGKALHSNQFTGSNSDPNASKALLGAIQSTQSDIEKWINTNFPFEGEILDVTEEGSRYKIAAAIAQKCNLNPNYLYIKFRESPYNTINLGVIEVDNVDDTVLKASLRENEYKRRSNRAKIAKPLDALWEEHKNKIFISDKE